MRILSIKKILTYQVLSILISSFIGCILIFLYFKDVEYTGEMKQGQFLALIPWAMLTMLNLILVLIAAISQFLYNRLYKYVLLFLSFVPVNLYFVIVSIKDFGASPAGNLGAWGMVLTSLIYLFLFPLILIVKRRRV